MKMHQVWQSYISFRRQAGILYVVFLAMITGCSTTSTVMDPVNLEEVKPYSVSIEYNTDVADDWKYLFESKLNAALVAAEIKAESGAFGANVAEIKFTTFRLRDDGTRLMAGIFAGTDEVTSEIIVKDSTGMEIGRGVVKTENASAWGSNDGYLEDHAKDIVRFLKGESE